MGTPPTTIAGYPGLSLTSFAGKYPGVVPSAASAPASSYLDSTGAWTVPVGSAGGVTQIMAGTNITLSPVGGTGIVTVNALTGGVSSVAAGTGITCSPSPITSSGSVSITNTTVTPSSYTLANFTVNAQGQLTAASSTTFPAKAQIISNAANTLINTANVFNVQAYGAKGDGTTNDSTNIAAAITALVANTSLATRGVLYFPAGTYLVSAAIAISIANPFTFTVCGDGMLSSIIYQTTSATDGMTITLAKAGGGQAFAAVEVRDLGFTTNTTAACALRVTYGTATVSTEYACGLNIRNINIVNNGSAPGPNLSNTYGWNNGIYLNSPWKVILHNINGAGGWNGSSKPVTAGYTTTTTVGPTTGGSVPGGGALITIYGGINVILSQIYGCYFACGIFFGNQNQGVNTVLGVENPLISDINLVAVNVGMFQAPGFATTGMQVSNFAVDFGSSDATVANIGLFINGDPINLRGQNSFTNCTFTPSGGTAGDVMIQLNNVLVSSVTAATMFPNIPSGSFAVKLLGSCDRNVFSGCGFGSGALSVGASCTNNLANNTQSSTTAAWTAVATNSIKTTLF